MIKKNMVRFYKDADEVMFKGSMYQPKGTNNSSGEKLKFFDALFYGVPVAVENGLKVVDAVTWEKVMCEFSEEEIHDLTFEKVLFKGVTFKKFLFSCTFKDSFFECCVCKNSFLNCTFQSCSYSKVMFGTAGIRMCKAVMCKFKECDLSHTNIDCDMDDCQFTDCSFSHANIYTSLIKNCSFTRCDFSYARLRRGSVYKTSMLSPNFYSATIDGTRFDASEITDANYECIGITMAGATREEVANLKNHILKVFTPTFNT